MSYPLVGWVVTATYSLPEVLCLVAHPSRGRSWPSVGWYTGPRLRVDRSHFADAIKGVAQRIGRRQRRQSDVDQLSGVDPSIAEICSITDNLS